jgi:hypothetical protein
MVALRYDIQIRNNAFAFRVEFEGEESLSDISIFKPETADDAHLESRNLNKLGVSDNPYAIGGVRFGYNPHTGLKTTKNPATTPSAPKAHHQPAPNIPATTIPNLPTIPLPPRPGQAEQSNGRTQRGSGYKGKNFNPNYGGGARKRDW